MHKGAAERFLTHDPLVGQVLHGRYRIVRRIGKGGMGVVYLAEHVLLRKQVAIKTLAADAVGSQDAAERFLREAQAAATVGNEHIVDVTDMGVLDSGALFFALEYLDGADLAFRVASTGPLEVQAALALMLQLCDALAAVHAAGIVHRDLKPENLFLVQRNGRDFLKVLDFGICKILEPSAHKSGLTSTGTMLGTPSYMSPEQVGGERVIDHRADIYAIGAIGYFMLVGEPPFTASILPKLLLAICHDAPPPLQRRRPDVPDVMRDAIMRALSKDPETRFGDCAAFRDALRPALATAPTAGAPTPPTVSATVAKPEGEGAAHAAAVGAASPDAATAWDGRPGPGMRSDTPHAVPSLARDPRRRGWTRTAGLSAALLVLILALVASQRRVWTAAESPEPDLLPPAAPAAPATTDILPRQALPEPAPEERAQDNAAQASTPQLADDTLRPAATSQTSTASGAVSAPAATPESTAKPPRRPARPAAHRANRRTARPPLHRPPQPHQKTSLPAPKQPAASEPSLGTGELGPRAGGAPASPAAEAPASPSSAEPAQPTQGGSGDQAGPAAAPPKTSPYQPSARGLRDVF